MGPHPALSARGPGALLPCPLPSGAHRELPSYHSHLGHTLPSRSFPPLRSSAGGKPETRNALADANASASLAPRSMFPGGPGNQAWPQRGVAAQATRGRKKGSAGGVGAPIAEGDEEKRRQRYEALSDVISMINEEHGKGTVAPLETKLQALDLETFSSGVLPLDVALGGGWPRGRILEVYGHESSGKTTLALYAIAQVQRLGQTAVLIDAEHALDMSYAQKLGVITEGMDRLLLVQPSSGDEAINVAEKFVRSRQVSLIVVDSVSALVPQAELDGLVGEGAIAGLARLMSTSLRRLGGIASKAGCTIMFLNQIRNKIGVYGNPEITSGGNALKYYASVRCEMRSIEKKKLAGEDIGFRCRVRVVKSKVFIPYKVAEFDLLFGRGIQHEASLLDLGEKLGIVGKRGAYYYCNGEAIQGREKAIFYLQENPEVAAELDREVRESIQAGKAGDSVEKDELLGDEGEGGSEFEEPVALEDEESL